MRGKTIALCGPDGAGKSTLAAVLEQQGWAVQYGGKKANHILWSTRIAFALHQWLVRRRARWLSPLYLYGVFYPLEYAENRARVRRARRANQNGVNVVFDRFVVDRMWRVFSPRHHYGDRVYHCLYRSHFPAIDAYVFLLPPAAVLMERAPYHSSEQCEAMRTAYQQVAEILADGGQEVLVLPELREPEQLSSELQEWIDGLGR